MGAGNPEDTKAKMKKLLKEMTTVKRWFHFTRNNPCHTRRFYHELIGIVGYDNWPGIRAEIRQDWEDAARRFDAQYGLVKAWCKELEANIDVFKKIESNPSA